jgi:hypothetical protein
MRVQDPVKYAEVLLSMVRPSEGYSQDRIRRMFGDNEIDISFPNFIPVHLTYQTAFVDDRGDLEFREMLDRTASEAAPLAPTRLIPVALNQRPTGIAVLFRELRNIAQMRKPHARAHQCAGPHHQAMAGLCRVRVLRPHPCWKEDVDAARLHVPWRHGEDKRTGPFDLAPRHRCQKIDNAVDMPIGLEILRLAGMVPGRCGEIAEVVLRPCNVQLFAN